ncbi:MAG: beta-ketoacyl-[acyl-carrier-protein] synthase family protein [Micromonosporaceae bacterium]
MSVQRRVVVTGLGPVSSIGTGVAAFGAALRAGRSGVSPIRSFDASGFPYRVGAEVTDFAPQRVLQRLPDADWGRASQFAAVAARLAAEDAKLDLAGIEPTRAGAVIGTSNGESVVPQRLAQQHVSGGLPSLDPELIGTLPAYRLAHAVSTELGLEGESLTVGTACSASNYALGYAYDVIASGEADVMFAGGAEAQCRWMHAGFSRLGALSETVCSPFDRDRPGVVIGEGGAVLVLESAEHAERRGARRYADVLGYGLNCDARHPVALDTDSVTDAMRIALANAGVTPSEVDYICAHGTGTPKNDASEAAAIFTVYGTDPPPVSSVKSMLGHTLGAAAGFGAIASVLAIDQGFLPPTINWSHRDPAFASLDPVPNQSRPARVRIAQNNSFAFGGNNAIVLFGAVT